MTDQANNNLRDPRSWLGLAKKKRQADCAIYTLPIGVHCVPGGYVEVTARSIIKLPRKNIVRGWLPWTRVLAVGE